MTSEGSTWPLLQTVFESILEVFILCFAGWALARRGILDKRTQKKLNILNINLFTPALLFSKVAFFLSPSKLKELWVIPFIFVIVTGVSTLSGWILGKLVRLKRSQLAFAIAASMFMNSNSLPIALMQSLVVTVHGLKWGKDDTRDGMLGRALTYLVLHSTFGMMLRWSYGVKLLTQADDDVGPNGEPITEGATVVPASPEQMDQPLSDPEASETSPLLNVSYRDYSSATLGSMPSTSHISESIQNIPPHYPYIRPNLDSSSNFIAPTRFVPRSVTDPPRDPIPKPKLLQAQTDLPPQLANAGKNKRPLMINRKSHFFYSFPNTPALSSTSLSNSREAIDQPPTTPPLPVETAPPSFWSRIWNSIKHAWSTLTAKLGTFWNGVSGFMTPPLYAALLSLIVACIPPFQHALAEHLRPVKGAISSAGACSIPVTLVVLGGYFWREKSPDEQEQFRTNLPQQIVEEANRRRSRDERPRSEVTLVGSVRGALNAIRMRTKNPFQTHDQPITDIVDPIEPTANVNGNGNGSIPQPVVHKSKEHKGENRTVLVAILARMIVTPLILLPIMAVILAKTEMRLFDDPVFVLSNVLFISSPPALTLAQITQAASGDAFERLISKTIFWSYCVVTPITTMVYVFIGLEMSRL